MINVFYLFSAVNTILSCCSREKILPTPMATIDKRYRGKVKEYQNQKRKRGERERELHGVCRAVVIDQ